MKLLLPLLVVFSFCSAPSGVRIGMPFNDFSVQCKVTADELLEAKTVETADSRSMTIVLKAGVKDRDGACAGEFKFVNGKLDSISR